MEKKIKKLVFVIITVCLMVTTTITFAYYTPEKQTIPVGLEHCLGYNLETLEIIDEGKRGWLLADVKGQHRMVMLDNEDDAKAALALAKNHKQICFIGRDNRRPNRKDYIVTYWK